jgi:hypothetical protein
MERFNAWAAPIFFGLGVSLSLTGLFKLTDHNGWAGWTFLGLGVGLLAYFYLVANKARERRR